MRVLVAELVNNIAEQHESEKGVIIQTEALNIIAAAIHMQLDDTPLVQLKNEINEGFASQHECYSTYTDEKHILQCAVEDRFGLQTRPLRGKIIIQS